ncbi:enoyl-CoA hydratase/isomerase family protein [Paraburkholderia caribensis]|uniref:enoyl-CoA hydratase/isomerase family protein n=1 Tax=Paraburkholderia caribensis TaxID=75105 RepID=UPI001D0716F5|nr:enoyl-CoA hydratase-related protein [Paraburkholderia caribensis]
MSIDFKIIDQSIAHITINRPERLNSLDVQHDRSLANVWKRFNENPDLKVAILTGAGGRAFCTGADILDYIPHRRRMAEHQSGNAAVSFGGLTADNDVTKPTIAAIDGFCVAGGLELALACDIRIATHSARFALPEVKWGILPGGGGTQRLGKIVGLGVAMRMILTGDEISAEVALNNGLVTDVVDRHELHDVALDIARRIVSNGPLAVAAARQAVLASFEVPLFHGLAQEAELQRHLLLTDDAREGVAAFSERRKPRYIGR